MDANKASDANDITADAGSEVGTVWRTIETAPKDGTWVLLTGCISDDEDRGQPCVVGQWTNYLNGNTLPDGWWQFAWFDGGYYGRVSPPTHWMPLPSPPGDP